MLASPRVFGGSLIKKVRGDCSLRGGTQRSETPETWFGQKILPRYRPPPHVAEASLRCLRRPQDFGLRLAGRKNPLWEGEGLFFIRAPVAPSEEPPGSRVLDPLEQPLGEAELELLVHIVDDGDHTPHEGEDNLHTGDNTTHLESLEDVISKVHAPVGEGFMNLLWEV